MMLGEDYHTMFRRMSAGRELICVICNGTGKNPYNEEEKCTHPDCHEGKIWIDTGRSLRRR